MHILTLPPQDLKMGRRQILPCRSASGPRDEVGERAEVQMGQRRCGREVGGNVGSVGGRIEFTKFCVIGDGEHVDGDRVNSGVLVGAVSRGSVDGETVEKQWRNSGETILEVLQCSGGSWRRQKL